MTVNEAGKLGAEKRRQIEREPVLEMARKMRASMKMPPHVGLVPPLILTNGDRA